VTRALAAIALALACGACTIGRDYIGNSFRSDPHAVLHPGVTTLQETLDMFGAPERIQRRHDGDVLVYRFVRHNESQLQIRSPGIGVVPAYTLFTYNKQQLKADRLTLFFDEAGTLTAFGYTPGTTELDVL
jgi:hypothetical protein